MTNFSAAWSMAPFANGRRLTRSSRMSKNAAATAQALLAPQLPPNVLRLVYAKVTDPRDKVAMRAAVKVVHDTVGGPRGKLPYLAGAGKHQKIYNTIEKRLAWLQIVPWTLKEIRARGYFYWESLRDYASSLKKSYKQGRPLARPVMSYIPNARDMDQALLNLDAAARAGEEAAGPRLAALKADTGGAQRRRAAEALRRVHDRSRSNAARDQARESRVLGRAARRIRAVEKSRFSEKQRAFYAAEPVGKISAQGVSDRQAAYQALSRERDQRIWDKIEAERAKIKEQTREIARRRAAARAAA